MVRSSSKPAIAEEELLDSFEIAGFADGHLARLDDYKTTIARLFPALRRDYVDAWSIQNTDALILSRFLEHYPHRVLALEIGTFVGVSAFHLTGQPKVSEVVCVDPNPFIADEINDKSNVTRISVEADALRSLRVLDVARAALGEFPEQESKVQLTVGVVGSTRVEIQGNSLESMEKVEVPQPPEGMALFAFVDGLHTEEGVRADLEAIFSNNPRAVAVLDDCRPPWGPAIRAGAKSFMERAAERYRFEVLGESCTGLARSSLGIVYPESGAAEVEQALAGAVGSLARQPELLWLLRREEELFEAGLATTRNIRQIRTRLVEARQRIAHLEKRNSRLASRQSSRRYRLADMLVEGALRIPGIEHLSRRRSSR